MSKNITTTAVTGGIVAGKTSVMVHLKEELPRYGVKPFFVSEAATDLFSAGASVSETPNIQELIMRRMLSDENIMRDAAASYSGDMIPVIICDRGILDCIPYSKPGEFETIAAKLGTSLHELRERYDLVIHLVTTANGAPDVFKSVFHENPFRIEGKNDQGEQSIELALKEAVRGDQQVQNAWLGSQKLKVIPNRSSFEQKKREVLKEILGALGLPIPQELEYKYLVPKVFSRDDIPVPHETVHLIQYYLDPTPRRQVMNYPKHAEKIIERVRIRQCGNSRSYIYTLKAFVPGDADPYELEATITENEFVQLVSYANSQPIRKDRTCFVYQNQYFEFDQFEKPIDAEGNNLLELEVSDKTTEVILPDFIPKLINVTNNDLYRNENIARRIVSSI